MRYLPPALMEALQRRTVVLRWFLWIETRTFEGVDAPIGFWTGSGVVTVEGRDYIGGGGLFQIGEMMAESDMSSPTFEIYFSGVDEEALRAMRGYRIDQAPITVYMGLLDAGTESDAGTRQLVGLFRHFKGFIDRCQIPTPKPGETSVISCTCASVSRSLRGKSGLVRSDAAQQQLYPGDTFRKYRAGLRGKKIPFGTGGS